MQSVFYLLPEVIWFGLWFPNAPLPHLYQQWLFRQTPLSKASQPPAKIRPKGTLRKHPQRTLTGWAEKNDTKGTIKWGQAWSGPLRPLEETLHLKFAPALNKGPSCLVSHGLILRERNIVYKYRHCPCCLWTWGRDMVPRENLPQSQVALTWGIPIRPAIDSSCSLWCTGLHSPFSRCPLSTESSSGVGGTCLDCWSPQKQTLFFHSPCLPWASA